MAGNRHERSREEPGRTRPEDATAPDRPNARSEVDAMGLEKRRSVVGESYGPSLGKQFGVYGVFITVVAALAAGFLLLARELDQPPENHAAEAPWAQPGVEQQPPRALDFPRNGPTEVD